MARLDARDLVPFRAAIHSGLDAVMVGHLLVRAVDPEPRPRSPRRWSAACSASAWASAAWSSPTPWRWAPSPAPSPSRWPPSGRSPPGSTSSSLSGHTAVPAVLGHLERAVAAGRLSKARVREAFLRVQRFKRVDRWAGC